MHSIFSWPLTENLITCEPAAASFQQCVHMRNCGVQSHGSSTSAHPRLRSSRRCHRSPDSIVFVWAPSTQVFMLPNRVSLLFCQDALSRPFWLAVYATFINHTCVFSYHDSCTHSCKIDKWILRRQSLFSLWFTKVHTDVGLDSSLNTWTNRAEQSKRDLTSIKSRSSVLTFSVYILVRTSCSHSSSLALSQVIHYYCLHWSFATK